MVVPVESLTVPMSAPVRQAALLFDRLGVSVVLHFGYGMGEAVAVAAAIDPGRIEPSVEAMGAFTDEELLGLPGTDPMRMMAAVSCRNELMDAVRDIVAAHPKPGTGGDRR